MVRSNKLAGWHSDDFGWRWVIEAWTVLFQNVCFIEGMVHESQSIAGIVHESQSIEGTVDDSQDVAGKIGCGEKL